MIAKINRKRKSLKEGKIVTTIVRKKGGKKKEKKKKNEFKDS